MVGPRSIAATSRGRLRRRVAAAALLVSVPINVVGIVALAAMYAGFAGGAREAALAFGRINDILGIFGAALLAPAVIEIAAVSGPDRRELRAVLAVVGLGAIAAIVWLQILLVTDRIPFEEQIGPVMVAYLALAVWFVIGGWTAARAGAIEGGSRLGVIAATYVGQPWWALRWGLRLLELSAATSGADTPPSEPEREGAAISAT